MTDAQTAKGRYLELKEDDNIELGVRLRFEGEPEKLMPTSARLDYSDGFEERVGTSGKLWRLVIEDEASCGRGVDIRYVVR
ncbi:MAG: hypothetical protein ABH849_04240 [Nanoarchaeota archaeon]